MIALLPRVHRQYAVYDVILPIFYMVNTEIIFAYLLKTIIGKFEYYYNFHKPYWT